MKKLKVTLLCTIINLFSVIQSSYANWPVFSAPDKDILLQEKLIDTRNCQVGKGKILAHLSLNIHKLFCKTFCPTDWMWLSNSDEQCHDLATHFNWQKYIIEHFNDADGTLYTVVTAFYGKEGYSSNLSFTFVSPKEHWYCYELNQNLHTITCANDI